MPFSPGLLLTLIVILAAGLLLQVLFVALIWTRLRKLEAAPLPIDLANSERRDLAVEEPPRTAIARQSDDDPPQSAPPRRYPGPPVVRIAAPVLRADPAEPSAVSGPTLITVPKLSAAVPSQATATVTRELGLRFGPIWEMADTGATADAIARATGQPVGQIELILALRRQAALVADGPRHA